ncbi:hypothetical protein AB0L68_35645 [Streptomyces sp. NPDC052164]|uniref:hypothetical protein n=1 Tax=Streptomyces sp. NPDC052164 TaxID=3155529 RepID=UPI003412C552
MIVVESVRRPIDLGLREISRLQRLAAVPAQDECVAQGKDVVRHGGSSRAVHCDGEKSIAMSAPGPVTKSCSLACVVVTISAPGAPTTWIAADRTPPALPCTKPRLRVVRFLALGGELPAEVD